MRVTKNKNISCNIPAKVTPYDNCLAKLRFSLYEVNKLKIKTIFKMIGAAAAAANLLLEFKIPEKKDERLTNNKKGNVILVNSTARLNFTSLRRDLLRMI